MSLWPVFLIIVAAGVLLAIAIGMIEGRGIRPPIYDRFD